MDNRDFKGVWFPKEIWLNKELTLVEKAILVEIDSLDNENHCTAGNEYLAEFCGCSERKVSEAIKKLCSLGYIEIVSFDGRCRKIKSLLSCIALNSMQGRKICDPPSKNLQAIKIDNNIDNKEDISTTSSRYTGNEVNSDFDNHGYSPDELKAEFLGSIKHKKPSKNAKPSSLYDKCLAEISKYTQDLVLYDSLVKYLSIRLAMKDKPIYGVNQWIGMLNKLSDLVKQHKKNPVDIVNESIERGWASFFVSTSCNNKDKFSEYGEVHSVREDGDVSDEEF